jgi:uncharacterized protein
MRAVALGLALAACGPSPFPDGEPLARYEVVAWDGVRLGSGQLTAASEGRGRVEHFQLEHHELPIAMEATIGDDPAAPCYRRRLVQAGAVVRTTLDDQGWSRRAGVAIERVVPGEPFDALHNGRASATSGGWALGSSHWAPALAALDGAPLGEPVSLRSLNLFSGRVEDLRLEVRERRTLLLGGEPVEATRVFAHCAAEGRNLWVADDRVLAVDEAFSGLQIRLEGLELPEAQHAPLPAGLREIEIQQPTPAVRLAGTLTLPAPGHGPPPVVILIHGSGGIDRDGDTTGLRHGSFRVLARLLAEQGLAVLRYDKRGVAESTMDGEITSTLDDLAEDVVAWMDHLQGRADVDGGRVYLVGHSEGGYIAPMVASQDARVVGVVMLAGPVSPLSEILKQQLALILEAHGVGEDEVRVARRAQDASIEVIRSGRDRDLPMPLMSEAGSDWFRSHFHHDPAAALREVGVPVLAIYGGVDLQVPSSEVPLFEELMRGRPTARVELIADMDHVLSASDTPGLGLYGDPDRGLHPGLLALLSGWFQEREGDVAAREPDPEGSGSPGRGGE